MKIYISGKITGLVYKDAEAMFAAAEKTITDAGHEAVNPMKEIPYDPTWLWEDYMLADIKLIFPCDGIFMLDNWQGSAGARIEHAIAMIQEKKIYFTNTPIL